METKELARASNLDCPCGSGKPYSRCCGPLHQGEPAPTPEALMRSRYSAFALENAEYLLRTWHPQTRPAKLDFDPVKWIGLKILSTQTVGPDEGRVRFVARGRINGCGFRMEEDSRFLREGGFWYYIDGKLKE